MRSRYAVLILVPIFLCLLGAGAYYYSGSRCPGITCVSFSGKERFKTTTVYENTATSYRALLDNGSVLLRVEKYRAGKDDAQMYADAKAMQILGLYEDAKSPYPGMLSDRISCDDRYKPVFQEHGSAATVFTGLLNSEMQYGTCIDDQIAFSVAGAMTYCPQEGVWYFLEFMESKKQPSAFLKKRALSVRCR